MVTTGVESATGKKTTFDVSSPAPGLTTVTEAVFAVAISEAGTLAVNCELLTNVVASRLPFQFTTEPETNPVPFSASVKPPPPGATASGTSGWLMSGTGLVCARVNTPSVRTRDKNPPNV